MTRAELRHQILLALLQGDATAACLSERVTGHEGRAPASLYFALREMEASGSVSCWEGPPLPREARARVHYHLTAQGLLCIAQGEERQTRSCLRWLLSGAIVGLAAGMVWIAPSGPEVIVCVLVLMALACVRLSRGWP